MLFNNQSNRKPWKFINNRKKLYLHIDKAIKYSTKTKWILIDARTKLEYRESHIPNSAHINFINIKKFILTNNKKTKILIIGRQERTFAWVASWAKAEKYNHIYLLKHGINHYLDSDRLIKP